MSKEVPLDNPDYEKLFNLYYPVIENARKVRERYTPVIEEDGKKKRKPILVCPDVTAEMIVELNKAEAVMMVVRNKVD